MPKLDASAAGAASKNSKDGVAKAMADVAVTIQPERKRSDRPRVPSSSVADCFRADVAPPAKLPPARVSTETSKALSGYDGPDMAASHFTFVVRPGQSAVPTSKAAGGRRVAAEDSLERRKDPIADPPAEPPRHEGRKPLNGPKGGTEHEYRGRRRAPADALVTGVGASLKQIF